MLSQIIKVFDPQRDFWPLKESGVDPVAVVAAFYAEESKKTKTGRNPKMRPKLVLKITRKTS